ncbi:hypothetical protein RB195_014429 [Necator americanus]|uniref:Uncharacterized protein n=1 Tax=Necator americanus TaxID=51031 RepID=A0ABR1E1P2_NECAM
MLRLTDVFCISTFENVRIGNPLLIPGGYMPKPSVFALEREERKCHTARRHTASEHVVLIDLVFAPFRLTSIRQQLWFDSSQERLSVREWFEADRLPPFSAARLNPTPSGVPNGLHLQWNSHPTRVSSATCRLYF